MNRIHSIVRIRYGHKVENIQKYTIRINILINRAVGYRFIVGGDGEKQRLLV